MRPPYPWNNGPGRRAFTTSSTASTLSPDFSARVNASLNVSIAEITKKFPTKTNLAHGGNLIFQSECQMAYVMDALRLLITGSHTTIEPSPEAHDEYQASYRSEIDQMVWSHWSIRHSHFKNPDGKIHTISPWPIPTYWKWTRSVDPTDYVLDQRDEA